MAIGTGTAILAASAVSAGGQMYASGKASSASSKAAAASNALQQSIFNENKATLSPYVQSGNAATAALNELLGLSTTTSSTGYLPTGAQPGQKDWRAYVYGSPDLLADMTRQNAGGKANWTPETFGPTHFQMYGQGEGREVPVYGSTGGGAGGGAAKSAFDKYKESAGYTFGWDEGMRALNTGLASRGMLESGAAQKAALRYGQDYSRGYFKDYLGLLSNQQGVGLSAAGAQAGVSTGYANSVSSNNNAAAAAKASAYGALGQGISNIAGDAAYLASRYLNRPSSYGTTVPPVTPYPTVPDLVPPAAAPTLSKAVPSWAG